MRFGSKGDILGRLVGMLVFLVGIGLLVVVFSHAFQLFSQSPETALHLRFTGDPKKDPLLANIGASFGWILLRVGFLIVMSLAASLISQRGINLYFSAMHGAPLTARTLAAPAPHVEVQGETS